MVTRGRDCSARAGAGTDHAPALSSPLGTRGRIALAATPLATLVGAIALVSAWQFGGGDLLGSGFLVMLPSFAVDVVAFASVGAILILRRPGNRVGLVLMVAAALIVLTFLGFFYGAALTAARGKDDVVAGFTALIGALGIYPTIIIAAGPCRGSAVCRSTSSKQCWLTSWAHYSAAGTTIWSTCCRH